MATTVRTLDNTGKKLSTAFSMLNVMAIDSWQRKWDYAPMGYFTRQLNPSYVEFTVISQMQRKYWSLWKSHSRTYVEFTTTKELTLTTHLPPVPLKLRPYGAIQIWLLLLLLLSVGRKSFFQIVETLESHIAGCYYVTLCCMLIATEL